jgi:hypothetical protein
MATVKTSAELINEAATDIGALGPGEALSAEDFATFDGKLDGLLETLNFEEGIYISDKDEIDFALFLPLARLLGNVSGSAVVGAPLNDDAWQRDVKSLKRMLFSKGSTEPLKVDFM